MLVPDQDCRTIYDESIAPALAKDEFHVGRGAYREAIALTHKLTRYLPHGLFSLDGVHPTTIAAAPSTMPDALPA